MSPRSFHSVSDVGRDRPQNEDCRGEFVLGDGSVLLVVCDGMGGHEHGEVASRLAVDAIGQIFQNSPAPDPRERLRNGFLVANQRILGEAERRGAKAHGMGTTAVAAFVRGAEAYVAHVGDSRLYQIRNGQVHWKTSDHTEVQQMLQRGILTPAEAKVHPNANVVNRALGFATGVNGTPLEPEVQATPLALVTGDSLVLCSDGLIDGVSDDEIASYIGGRDAPGAAQALVDLANERGGHDNITVTVLHYGVNVGGFGSRPQGGPGRRTMPDVDAPAAPASGGSDAGDDLPPAGGRARTVIGIAAGVLGLGLAGLAVAHYLRGKPSVATVPPTPAPADAGAAPTGAPDGARAGAGAVSAVDARAVAGADARLADALPKPPAAKPVPAKPPSARSPAAAKPPAASATAGKTAGTADGGIKPGTNAKAAGPGTPPRAPAPPAVPPPPAGAAKADGGR